MSQHLRRLGAIALALLMLVGMVSMSEAAKKRTSRSSASRSKVVRRAVRRAPKPVVKRAPESPKSPYEAYAVIEPTTGQILAESNADKPWSPASLAKMMLTLIVMEHVEQGKTSLTTPIRVSKTASGVGGSQVYLKEGETFPLEQMMRAIEIASANDACAAVAEAVVGSQEAMVERMNQRARELGMIHTAYVNVHGLPADEGKPDNTTTARDMAVLAREMVQRFPKVLEWSSTVQAPFRRGQFVLHSTNRLFLQSFQGADGLKTGYHRKSGFNLVATAQRNGVRLVSVVLGSPSPQVRANETMRLMNEAFSRYERRVVLKKGETLPNLFYVKGSEHVYIPLQAAHDISVFARRTEFSNVRVKLERVRELAAPAKKGDPAGQLVALLDGKRVAAIPAVVSQDVPKARLTWRIWNWRTPRPTAEEFLHGQVEKARAGF